MVGSINAPQNGTNTYDAFVAAARAIGTNEVTVSITKIHLVGYRYQNLTFIIQESDSGTPVLTGLGAVATGPPVAATAAAGGGSSSGAMKTAAKAGFYLASAGVILSLI